MTFTQAPWSLKDLFPATDAPELESAFAELQQRVTEFEKYRPDLAPAMDVEHFM